MLPEIPRKESEQRTGMRRHVGGRGFKVELKKKTKLLN